MGEIVQFQESGIPANTADLIKGLQTVNASLEGSAGGVPYLRLLKSGAYAYGPDNIEPEPHSRWAVNPFSIQHGYACWGDGELLGEHMVPFNQNPSPRSELPDYGEPWLAQVSMTMQCMNGEDKGTTVLYRGTAKGLHNAVKKLINEIIGQAQHNQTHIVPLLALDVDSYQHKKYGEIFFPVLDIVDWLSLETGESAEPVEPEEEKPEAESAVGNGRVAGADAGEEKVASGRTRGGNRRTKRGKVADADNEPAAPRSRRRRQRA